MKTAQLIVILTLAMLVASKGITDEKPATVRPPAQRVLEQEPNSWVKRSPSADGPGNPMLGYEASLGYDPIARKIIRWAGHTQSGGHEQQNETWTYDPLTATFALIDTNQAPPGGCCVQQNVFDPVSNRFLRFRSFAGNHGWHWFRENYLSNTSVWSFDLAAKTWWNMRPLPEPVVSALRCASWDAEHQVVVIFGGEGNQEGTVVYDPYLNIWTRKHPKVQPPFRSGGNMVYDSKRKRHILFGAQFTDDPHTWAYSLSDNAWTDLKPKLQPPTNKNDAVLAYDEGNDVVVASVNVIDAMAGDEAVKGHYETWIYRPDANTWEKMTTKVGPPGYGSRRKIMCYVPDLNVTVMENYVNPAQRIPGVDREQQMWTYRYAERPPAGPYVPPLTKRQEPALVQDVVASVLSERKIALRWQPPPGNAPHGYHVERAVVEVFTEDQLQRLRKDTAPLTEPSVGAIQSIGAFERLTKAPIREPRFEDTTVDLNRPPGVTGEPVFRHRFSKEQINADGVKYRFAVYAYRVRAVNAKGLESGPSPYVLTIPSSPQWFYSQEAGDDCRLKWTKNPEAGIRGYRVYRMESPRINGPGQKVTRVTADPITGTTYTDVGIGKDQRRYWIVAVDALGQEGIPSAPAWHYRLYRKIYEPFVGEWRQ